MTRLKLDPDDPFAETVDTMRQLDELYQSEHGGESAVSPETRELWEKPRLVDRRVSIGVSVSSVTLENIDMLARIYRGTRGRIIDRAIEGAMLAYEEVRKRDEEKIKSRFKSGKKERSHGR